LQVKPHVPLHVAVAFAGAVHALVQEPQWAGSLSSFTQNPLHSEYVLLHAKVQAPLVQVGLALTTPVVQVKQALAVPHAFAVLPAWQVPAAQQPVPHVVPQPPQWFGSVCSLTQTPLHSV
jgi:hypothetical protein